MLTLLVAVSLTAAPMNLDNARPCISLAFSPDDAKLAVGCEDNSVRMWDVTTGKRLWAMPVAKTPILEVAFSDDGKWVAAGDLMGTISIWNVSDGKVVGQFNAPDTISSLAFSPDKKALAVGCSVKCSGLYVTSGDFRLLALLPGAPVAWSADGKTLLVANDDALVLVDAKGKTLREVKTPARPMVVVGANDLKRVLARSGLENEIRILDAASAKELGRLKGHTKGVVRLVLTKDGTRAISGSEDRTARLWDVASGKELTSWANNASSTWVAISPGGKRVASADGPVVHVWPVK